MNYNRKIEFTNETIRKLFGSYDGEGENIERLKEYYFKTDTYAEVISELPLRILVGQKGIGKSALFRIAMAEQKEQGKFPILIKPDDIAEIGEKHDSLILSIKKWKFGLTEVIAKKVLNEFGLVDETINSRIIKVGGKIEPLLIETYKILQKKEDKSESDNDRFMKFIKEKKIIIYLDDIDRGWQDRNEGLIMISALINSLRDISNENENILFKLALRLDVYNAVREKDESSDKYEGSVVWHSYKLNEIYVMLVKRILTFWGENISEEILLKRSQKFNSEHLHSIFAPYFYGKGKWEQVPIYQVLLSLIRNRPRDIVKLCTMAAQAAQKSNSNLINSSHINEVLVEYSRSIIRDTIVEYRSELPQIENLIYGMKPNRKEKSTADCFVFTTAELHAKLWNIMQSNSFKFSSTRTCDVHELKRFLYKINFITARKTREDGVIIRKEYERDSLISTPKLDFGYDWEVHLAYRWDLQSENINDIFKNLSNS